MFILFFEVVRLSGFWRNEESSISFNSIRSRQTEVFSKMFWLKRACKFLRLITGEKGKESNSPPRFGATGMLI